MPHEGGTVETEHSVYPVSDKHSFNFNFVESSLSFKGIEKYYTSFYQLCQKKPLVEKETKKQKAPLSEYTFTLVQCYMQRWTL